MVLGDTHPAMLFCPQLRHDFVQTPMHSVTQQDSTYSSRDLEHSSSASPLQDLFGRMEGSTLRFPPIDVDCSVYVHSALYPRHVLFNPHSSHLADF